MTALIVFDIEAVPDFEAARRLLAQPDNMPDAEIRRMLGERYSRNNEDPTTTFLKVPIYRIVSIATLNAKRENGGGPWTVSQIGKRRQCKRDGARAVSQGAERHHEGPPGFQV